MYETFRKDLNSQKLLAALESPQVTTMAGTGSCRGLSKPDLLAENPSPWRYGERNGVGRGEPDIQKVAVHVLPFPLAWICLFWLVIFRAEGLGWWEGEGIAQQLTVCHHYRAISCKEDKRIKNMQG